MRGRRIAIGLGDDPALLLERSGDYCGPIVGFSGEKPAVFFLPPGSDRWSVHHVVSPPHVFRECDDGSLEIRESILSYPSRSGDWAGWHGYLREGHVWETC